METLREFYNENRCKYKLVREAFKDYWNQKKDKSVLCTNNEAACYMDYMDMTKFYALKKKYKIPCYTVDNKKCYLRKDLDKVLRLIRKKNDKLSMILDFSEALYELKNGKKIARLLWDKSRYVKMSDGQIMLWFDDEPCIRFEDSKDIYDALLAQDWEVIK